MTKDEMIIGLAAGRRLIQGEWADGSERPTARLAMKNIEARRRRKAAQVRAWKQANPEKVQAYNKKWRDSNRDRISEYNREYSARNIERYRALWAKYRAQKRAGRPPEATFGELLNKVLNANSLYTAAKGAVPCSLPIHARDDIVSEIVLAVLEGNLPIDDIKQVASRFVSSYWKARELYTLSLDAPIAGTDGLRLIDTLTAQEAGKP